MIIDDDEDDRYFFEEMVSKMSSSMEFMGANGCNEAMVLPESKSAEEMAICNTQELVIKNTQLCFKSTNFFGF